MWTHKERTNKTRQIDSARTALHRECVNEPVNKKAKEAFNRPLFGGVRKSLGEAKDEQK